MTSPEPNPEGAAPTATPTAGPRYPKVRVRLTGTDGNVFMLIGKVAVALRTKVGDAAADEFNTAAHACGSYDEVLNLIRATVKVS